MKEEDLVQRFEGYRDSLGTCSRAPVRAGKRVRLSWIAAAGCAVCVGTAFVWPSLASAARLRRLGDAITNAKSMELQWYVREPSGRWKLWQRSSYESGMWRNDFYVNVMRTPLTMIYKDGLCYEFESNKNYATVRPAEAMFNAPKLQGQALQVIEEQLMNRFKGTKVSLAASEPVDGRAVYRVLLDREQGQIHIRLLVDQATDLPLSADCVSASDPQHPERWEYRFNEPVSRGLFNVPKGRRLIDLRKTIPAFEAEHKTIATPAGLQILDACVTNDGTVWLATKPGASDYSVSPSTLTGVGGVHYTSGGFGPEVRLSRQHKLKIYGFAPLEPGAPKPTECTISVHKSTLSRPVSPDSPNMTAVQDLGEVGRASFAVRTEKGQLPNYFRDLGTDDDVPDIRFEIQLAKGYAFDNLNKFGDAARIWERLGVDCTPAYPAYFEWMNKAREDYEKAHLPSDASRIERLERAARR